MIGSPHKPTLFIDRNSGGRVFRGLIDSVGIKVVLHDDCFKRDTTDDAWLKEINQRGWIMITYDINTSKSPLFLYALKRSTARVFILDGLNGASPEGKAKCVIESYELIILVCGKREPPLFWRINREGKAVTVDFKHRLGLLRKAGKTNF